MPLLLRRLLPRHYMILAIYYFYFHFVALFFADMIFSLIFHCFPLRCRFAAPAAAGALRRAAWQPPCAAVRRAIILCAIFRRQTPACRYAFALLFALADIDDDVAAAISFRHFAI